MAVMGRQFKLIAKKVKKILAKGNGKAYTYFCRDDESQGPR